MKSHATIISLFFLLGSFAAFSQSDSNFKRAESLVKQAHEFRKQENYTQAANLFKKAAIILQKHEDVERSVEQYHNSIEMYRELREQDSIINLGKFVLSLLSTMDSMNYELLGITHHQSYTAYQNKTDHDMYKYHGQEAIQAYSYLPRPLQPGRYLDIAEILIAIEQDEQAILYCDSALLTANQLPEEEQIMFKILALDSQNRIFNRKGQFHRLLENANLMDKLAIQKGREDLLPFFANTKAIAYEMMGDLERAILFYKRGLDLRIIDLNIGRAYSTLEQYDSARKYVELALIPSRASPLFEEPAYPGELYWQSGEIYARMGNYTLSDSYFKQAVDFLEKNQYPMTLAQTLHDWAYFLHQRNELDIAHQHILRAIEILEQEESTDNQYLISSYSILGKILTSKGQWEIASQSFDQSINLLRLTNERETGLPDVDNVLYLPDYFNTLSAMIPGIYNTEFKQQKDLKYALEACHKAIEAITLLRQDIRRASSRELSSEKTFNICDWGVRIAYDLYHETQDPQYIEEAFFFSEQSKSILLQESLQKTQALEFAGLPDSLLQQEREIKANLAHYWQAYQEKRLAPQADSSSVALIRQKLEVQTEQYHQFEEMLEEKFPAYSQLFSLKTTLGITDLQNKLSSNHAGLLEYFWGNEEKYVLGFSEYAMIFSRLDTSQTHIDTLKSTLVNLYQSILREQIPFTKQSNQLYHWLVSPFLGQLGVIDRLIIIPDGPLGYFPFGMLAQETEGNKPRYLIERYPISYANSASLLFNKDQHRSTTSELSFAGFAPTYSGQLQLPYNREEVQILQTKMGGEGFVSTQATESTFREVSQSARILHFAMHGILNSSSPMQSHLLFGEADSSQEDDGRLYAYELYNLEIAAELAVLSACHTGYGPIAKGEGIRSLARAFQYAGCPSIMMSLWEANGVVAKDLMPLFYNNLKEGMAKDVALQQAQLTYLETAPDHLRDPRMWGNFVLIGDTGPLDSGQSFHWRILIGSIILITFCIGFWRYRMNQTA